jgi:hypothetical protein
MRHGTGVLANSPAMIVSFGALRDGAAHPRLASHPDEPSGHRSGSRWNYIVATTIQIAMSIR